MARWIMIAVSILEDTSGIRSTNHRTLDLSTSCKIMQRESSEKRDPEHESMRKFFIVSQSDGPYGGADPKADEQHAPATTRCRGATTRCGGNPFEAIFEGDLVGGFGIDALFASGDILGSPIRVL